MVNKRNHGKQIYILTYHSENTKSKTRRKNLESSKREKKVYRVQEHLRKINIWLLEETKKLEDSGMTYSKG